MHGRWGLYFVGADSHRFSFVFFGFLLPLVGEVLLPKWALRWFSGDLPVMGVGN